jgi:hypothetical protein
MPLLVPFVPLGPLVPVEPLPGVPKLPGVPIEPLLVLLVACATRRQPPNEVPAAGGASAVHDSTADGGVPADPCPPVAAGRMKIMFDTSFHEPGTRFAAWPPLAGRSIEGVYSISMMPGQRQWPSCQRPRGP